MNFSNVTESTNCQNHLDGLQNAQNPLQESSQEKTGKRILELELFLKFSESLTSTSNKKILLSYLPETKPWLDQLIGALSKLKVSENSNSVTSRERSNSLFPIEPSKSNRFSLSIRSKWRSSQKLPSLELKQKEDERIQQFSKDYQIAKCSHRILELYEKALEGLVHSLQTSSSENIKWNVIATIIKREALSEVETISIINQYFMTQLRPEILKNQQHLIEKFRQYKFHEISSYTDLMDRVARNLFRQAMKNPNDVQRAFEDQTLTFTETLSFNSDEISWLLAHTTDISNHYQLLLREFNHGFFKGRFVFDFFFHALEQFSLPLEKKLANFSTLYNKLMSLTDEEIFQLSTKFGESFPDLDFEKALKYFKFAQNFLGQNFFYLISGLLLDIHNKNFDKINFCRPQLEEKIKKSKVSIKIKEGLCEIEYSKINSVISPTILLLQKYCLLVNFEADTFQLRHIDLTLCCSDEEFKNEKLQDIFFNFNLILETLGLAKLNVDHKPLLNPNVNVNVGTIHH